MKTLHSFQYVVSVLFLTIGFTVSAQIEPGIYIADLNDVRHELKMTENYMIHTIYETDPARFVKTEGGFYTISGSELLVQLEFNSNYEADSVSSLEIPFAVEEGKLVLGTTPRLVFSPMPSKTQDLDGQWLFATRGPDTGQERRGEAHTRKTLKYLQDGRFQWIAYDTDGLQFKGTGGGSYTSQDGVYVENIEFFSRDNSRVGAELKFDYKIKEGDWHHTGNNSKGEPMYEIWSKR